jgi:hypothetical protein
LTNHPERRRRRRRPPLLHALGVGLLLLVAAKPAAMDHQPPAVHILRAARRAQGC